jgi:hypothetical protein
MPGDLLGISLAFFVPCDLDGGTKKFYNLINN